VVNSKRRETREFMSTKRGPPCLVSNKIGADNDPSAVAGQPFSRARDRGTTRSGCVVFRDPGYFIVSAVYMTAKRHDVIIEAIGAILLELRSVAARSSDGQRREKGTIGV